MNICKTPLRISFVGGGTDFEGINSKKNPGICISMTINKYVYIFYKKKNDKFVRVSYSKTENKKFVNQLSHKLIKSILLKNRIKTSVEVATIADVPSNGTGLGSSSALAVGLLNILKNGNIKREKLAIQAYKIEKEINHNNIGMQDHFSSACGGFNIYYFYPNQKVKIIKLKVRKKFLKKLFDHLLLFKLNNKRKKSFTLLKNIKKNFKKNTFNIKKLKSNAKLFLKYLQKENIEGMARTFDVNWKIKKKLSHYVTNSYIEDIYSLAKKNGAISGKVLGAGAGGYILFFVKKKYHKKLINSLKLQVINFDIDFNGSQVFEI